MFDSCRAGQVLLYRNDADEKPAKSEKRTVDPYSLFLVSLSFYAILLRSESCRHRQPLHRRQIEAIKPTSADLA